MADGAGIANSSAVDVNNSNTNNKSSASRNDNRGTNGMFNFNEYYERKCLQKQRHHDIQSRWDSEKASKLSNCGVVSFEISKKVNAEKLLDSLKLALSTDEFSSIVQVGQFITSKNWSIHFKDASNFESSMEKTITMDDESFQITDANDFGKVKEKEVTSKPFTMKAFLRLYWLPLDVSENQICCFIKSKVRVTVVNVKRENVRPKYEEVNNGVVSVKVEYDLAENQNVLDFAGLHRIAGRQALVQISGTPPKCLGCKQYGHVRKACVKCEKCSKYGHLSANCNLAKRTAPQDDDVEDLGEEHIQVMAQDSDIEAAQPPIQVNHSDASASKGKSSTASKKPIPKTSQESHSDTSTTRGKSSTGFKKPISITKELREAIKNKVKTNTSLTPEEQGVFKIMEEEKWKRAETNRLRQERVRKLAYEHYLAEHEALGHKRENMIEMFEGMDRKGQNEMLKVYMEPSKNNKAKKAGSPLSANDSKAQALDETTDTESEGGPIKIRFGSDKDGRLRLLSDVTSLDDEALEKMDATIKYNEETHKLEQCASGYSMDASNKEIEDFIRTGKYNWNNRRNSREKETELDLDGIG